MNGGRSGPWDAIVVGAGTAGIPCAVEAAARGARVLVLEKAERIGGTLWVTGGHLSGGGTRRQRERGIVDSPQAHYEDVLRVSHDTVVPEIARLACEEAPHTLDWLDELGFPWEPETPALVYGHEPYRVPRTVWGANAGRDILETIRPLWDEQVAAGRIELLLGARLTDLVVEAGAVVGVRAEGPGSAVAEHRAPAVALTAGGYAAAHDFYPSVTPGSPRLVSVAPPSSTGDGIHAARRSSGAGFRGAEKFLPTAFGIERPPGSGRSDFWDGWPAVVAHFRPPREIYVNDAGLRFLNEDDESPHRREEVIMELPDNRWWIVFDEAAIDAGDPVVNFWSHERVREEARRGEVVWRADTLEELARATGVIDPVGLVETVAGWNALVERGGPDPLGRSVLGPKLETAPFYALLNRATTFISFGGLAVDTGLRVLDEAGAPIPGLFAAGEIVGAGATSGNAFCSGMLVTPALSFGRRLGRALGEVAAGLPAPFAKSA